MAISSHLVRPGDRVDQGSCRKRKILRGLSVRSRAPSAGPLVAAGYHATRRRQRPSSWRLEECGWLTVPSLSPLGATPKGSRVPGWAVSSPARLSGIHPRQSAPAVQARGTSEWIVRTKREEELRMDEAHSEAERWPATVEQASSLLVPEGQRSVEILSHGTMVVKYSAPRGADRKTPHTSDELYVVAQLRAAPSPTGIVVTSSPPAMFSSCRPG